MDAEERDNHDQRFKQLLREFLPEFVELFFPDWAAKLDFADTEWLEQEAFIDPPGGEKRVLDVVAKVRARDPVPDPGGRTVAHSVVVVNVEIESPDRATDIRPRMLWYYEHLRQRYQLPVVPVCLFLKVGLEGIGWDTYEECLWEHSVLRFEFAYIGLPALDGMTYYNGASLLGLALSALMKLPATDRARIKAEGMARFTWAKENSARAALLAECFNNYLAVPPADLPEYKRLMAAQPKEVSAMVSSFEISGRHKGKRDVLMVLLETKFGPLPQDMEDRLDALPVERLDQIARAIITAQSLKELGLADE
jgi:hypothetical protein